MQGAGRRLAASLIIASAVGLAGCGSSKATDDPGKGASASESPDTTAAQRDALDAYVAAERASLPKVLKQNPGLYSDIVVKAEYPGTVRYRYVYAQNHDPAATARGLKKQFPKLQSLCETVIFRALESAGVSNPRASFMYYNADGSELESYTCTRSSWPDLPAGWAPARPDALRRRVASTHARPLPDSRAGR